MKEARLHTWLLLSYPVISNADAISLKADHPKVNPEQ